MNHKHLEQALEKKQLRLEELRRLESGEHATEEMVVLENEIANDLAQLKGAVIAAELEQSVKASSLSDAIKEAVKGDLHVEQEINSLSDEAEHIEKEVRMEEYRQLFATISLEGFSDDDKEVIKRRAEFFESGREDALDMKYNADSILQRLYHHPGNVELKKKIIVDFADDLMPYSMQNALNSIVQEDVSFLESGEFHKIKTHLAITGLKKMDMLVTRETNFVDPFDSDKEKLIDIWEMRSDVSLLETLPETDRTNARRIFLEGLSSETLSHSNISGSRVVDAARALTISDRELEDAVFSGFSNLLSKGNVPESKHLNSFEQAAQSLNNALMDVDFRAGIMKNVLDYSRKGRISSRKWQSLSDFIKATPEDRLAYLESLADCSQKETHNLKEEVFQELGITDRGEESSLLTDEEKKFVFERIPSEARSAFLAREIDHSFILERFRELPFTSQDLHQAILQRFSYRGIRSDVYDREVSMALHNTAEVFGTVFDQQEMLQEIYKHQLMVASNSEYDKSPHNILWHIQQNKVTFSKDDLIKYKQEIRGIYKTIVSSGSANQMQAMDRLADVFGEVSEYISSVEQYELIRQSCLGESDKDKKTFTEIQELVEFVPKEYKMRILTDPEWQEKFAGIYETYLSPRSNRWENSGVQKNIGFFIARTETYETAEAQAFQQLVSGEALGDLGDIRTLFFKMRATQPKSKTLEDIKRYIDAHLEAYLEQIQHYALLREFAPFVPGLEQRLQSRVATALSELHPGSPHTDEEIRVLFSVKYGAPSGDYYSYGLKYEIYTRFFRETKSFSFFERVDAQYSLKTRDDWDRSLEKILSLPDAEAQSHIALLSFLEASHDALLSAAEKAREVGLESFAALFESLEEVASAEEQVRVHPSDVVRQFHTLVGTSLDSQKRSLLSGCISTMIHRNNLHEAVRLLDKLEIPRESVGDAVFQQASRMLARKNVRGLAEIWTAFPELKERFDAESAHDLVFNNALSELNDPSVANKETKEARLRNMKQAFWVSERFDNLPPRVQEKVQSFQLRYGEKGARLVALAIAAYGIEHEDAFIEKISRIESVLALHDPEKIPKEAIVSCGIEYEVGKSIGNIYGEESAFGYKSDMQMLNEIAGMKSGGAGGQAIHEIATSPTTNPYLLIAEVKLLQEAGMLDFNFKKYPDAPRGYHLSLGGERGLDASSGDMMFLYKAITMTGNTGLLAGKEVQSVKSVHAKSLESVEGFNQKGERVEFKGMGGDTFEQFERTVVSAYHAGIASQLQDRFIGIQSEEFTRGIPDTLEEFLAEIDIPDYQTMSDKEKRIIFEWMQFKKQMILAVEQHNQSFIEAEFFGSFTTPEGEYRELNLEENYAAKRRRYFGKEDISLQKVQNEYQITSGMFQKLDADFVNVLTRANNLLIFKEPVLSSDKLDASGKVIQNSNAYAFQTEMHEEGYKKGVSGTPYASIFDREGKMRNGYYPIQGTSEEMITHKSQILLNRFNRNMESILRSS